MNIDIQVVKNQQKKKKIDHQQQEVAAGSNSCFDSLPDELIQHIISFLPAKRVVRTSIVSRRWRYLWTCVPRLHFDDGTVLPLNFECPEPFDVDSYSASVEPFGILDDPNNYFTKYKKFVDMVMSRHDSDLEKFSLMYSSNHDTSGISSWITGAISRKVQEFYLATHCGRSLLVPQSLFECTSLTSLTVKVLGSILTFPTASIHLPKLKVLHFDSVIFSVANCVGSPITAYFPSLEDLVLACCCFGQIASFSISAPILKNLYISVDPCGTFEEGVVGAVVKRKVMISAPNVVSMRCKGLVAFVYHIENPSSLVNGSLDFPTYSGGMMDRAWNAVKLFDLARNVTILSLSNRTLQVLSSLPQKSVLDQLPIFHNLKVLQIEAFGTRGHLQVICQLIRRTPILEFLSMDFDQIRPDTVSRRPDKLLLLLPFEFLCNHHLKVVRLDNINLNETQLEFMKCILENNNNSNNASSSVLERIEIKLKLPKARDEMLLNKELSNHPRVSSISSIKIQGNIIITILMLQ